MILFAVFMSGSVCRYLKYNEQLHGSPMISFKQFLLLEGGNVIIDNEEAERIDLSKHDRSLIVPAITALLKSVNAAFTKKAGSPLWNAALFANKSFLSGSAFHFFATEQIPDEKFKKVKPSVGDIDTQVDRAQKTAIDAFLSSSKGQTIGPAKLIGHKVSGEQFISLWHLSKFNINIQIDFELVDFAEGAPTAWAQFSHSSDWGDMTKKLKGVAHKMLLRALSAPKLMSVVIKAKTARGKDKEVLSASHAFSVTHGIRKKLKPVLDDAGKQLSVNGKPAYHEMSTSESEGVTDLHQIYEYFFGAAPSRSDLKKFGSFTGLIDLIKTKLPKEDWVKIADGFVNTLWGAGAQGLYRGDGLKDNEEKTAMVSILCDELGVSSTKYATTKEEYYKAYK